jgi:hypothetical protein
MHDAENYKYMSEALFMLALFSILSGLLSFAIDSTLIT